MKIYRLLTCLQALIYTKRILNTAKRFTRIAFEIAVFEIEVTVTIERHQKVTAFVFARSRQALRFHCNKSDVFKQFRLGIVLGIISTHCDRKILYLSSRQF